jgi:hypothetical protein
MGVGGRQDSRPSRSDVQSWRKTNRGETYQKEKLSSLENLSQSKAMPMSANYEDSISAMGKMEIQKKNNETEASGVDAIKKQDEVGVVAIQEVSRDTLHAFQELGNSSTKVIHVASVGDQEKGDNNAEQKKEHRKLGTYKRIPRKSENLATRP